MLPKLLSNSWAQATLPSQPGMYHGFWLASGFWILLSYHTSSSLWKLHCTLRIEKQGERQIMT
jgi:hypothetical protein